MADIVHELTVQAPLVKVFEVVGTPEGLARWWTKASSGTPQEGAEYSLFFAPEFDWKATVRRCRPDSVFELEMTKADSDWVGTRVGCELQPEGQDATRVRFYHRGWPAENEHWRISCYCWAMYLRIMRRYLEHGETVPYENRLEA